MVYYSNTTSYCWAVSVINANMAKVAIKNLILLNIKILISIFANDHHFIWAYVFPVRLLVKLDYSLLSSPKIEYLIFLRSSLMMMEMRKERKRRPAKVNNTISDLYLVLSKILMARIPIAKPKVCEEANKYPADEP